MKIASSTKNIFVQNSRKASALSAITMDIIDKVFSDELNKHSDIVKEILSIDETLIGFVPEPERAVPGNVRYVETGHYKTMLKRYFFAAAYFSRNQDVLDSCSGLGWGTYILSQYAHNVTAFDLDADAIEFSKRSWKNVNISWLHGNAMDTKLLVGKSFDVVMGMETIEHFDQSEIRQYIENMKRALNDRGLFIGTSTFPRDRKTADKLRATNPHHKRILTLHEIADLLDTYFSEHIIVDNWMFVARR